ncbi:MAG: DUF485 domain-containing protein [Bernardetiaceae bacterium]|nr:DUF485 domain-containing protein [Bernardetiaceae bacterium]
MNNLQNPQAVAQSAGFKKLVRNRWAVSLGLTVVMLAAYLGFILTVGFGKTTLAAPVGAHFNWGLVLGVGLIVFAWLITGLYVYWANHRYDPQVRDLRRQLKSQD